jgi:hypothetical protein
VNEPLAYAAEWVNMYRRDVGGRPVPARAGIDELTAMIGGPMPDHRRLSL